MANDKRRIVYLIECDVPVHLGVDPYYINEMFGDNLVAWNSYFPEEGAAPITIEITNED